MAKTVERTKDIYSETVEEMTVEEGSGNVFADLGFPNPEEHQLKSAFVLGIHQVMRRRKLTQTAAAAIAGINQSDLSKLLRGHHRGFSIDRLLGMLNALGQDVEITIRPKTAKTARPARVTVDVRQA